VVVPPSSRQPGWCRYRRSQRDEAQGRFLVVLFCFPFLGSAGQDDGCCTSFKYLAAVVIGNVSSPDRPRSENSSGWSGKQPLADKQEASMVGELLNNSPRRSESARFSICNTIARSIIETKRVPRPENRFDQST
jgi:hypothetical protein